MNRKAEREQAFILIFEKSFRPDSIEEILEDALNAENYENSNYSENCFRGVYDNLEIIDSIIENNLNGWTINRISKVALSILRLAVYEIKYVDSVPVGASINEAVELCKKYATNDDSSYVNGVLGAVARAE